MTLEDTPNDIVGAGEVEPNGLEVFDTGGLVEFVDWDKPKGC
jgi:hypothetical protein